jgi:hypothetical protein
MEESKSQGQKKITTILFADNQLIIADLEDKLQMASHNLNSKEPKRNKIVIDNKSIVQVNTFTYLGTSVSYENEKDIDIKISTFLKITGIINNIFKPNKARKNTRIKLYSTLALLVLLYSSDSWTIKAIDKARLISAEMKFMRRTAGYIWSDFKQNTEILELNVIHSR